MTVVVADTSPLNYLDAVEEVVLAKGVEGQLFVAAVVLHQQDLDVVSQLGQPFGPSVKKKVAPLPISDSAQISPPCRCTISAFIRAKCPEDELVAVCMRQ